MLQVDENPPLGAWRRGRDMVFPSWRSQVLCRGRERQGPRVGWNGHRFGTRQGQMFARSHGQNIAQRVVIVKAKLVVCSAPDRTALPDLIH